MIEVFVHVAKSGGTTVRSMFKDALGTRNILVVSNYMKKSERYPNVCRTGAVSDEIKSASRFKAIMGHLSVNDFPEDGRRFGYRFHTVVRDPIDRLISDYNFAIGNSDHPNHALAKQSSFIQFARLSPPNMHARRLGLGRRHQTIKEVMEEVSCVPIDSSIDYFSRLLSSISDYRFNQVKRLNETRKRFPSLAGSFITRADINNNDIDELTKMNADDFTLFQRTLLHHAC